MPSYYNLPESDVHPYTYQPVKDEFMRLVVGMGMLDIEDVPSLSWASKSPTAYGRCDPQPDNDVFGWITNQGITIVADAAPPMGVAGTLRHEFKHHVDRLLDISYSETSANRWANEGVSQDELDDVAFLLEQKHGRQKHAARNLSPSLFESASYMSSGGQQRYQELVTKSLVKLGLRTGAGIENAARYAGTCSHLDEWMRDPELREVKRLVLRESERLIAEWQATLRAENVPNFPSLEAKVRRQFGREDQRFETKTRLLESGQRVPAALEKPKQMWTPAFETKLRQRLVETASRGRRTPAATGAGRKLPRKEPYSFSGSRATPRYEIKGRSEAGQHHGHDLATCPLAQMQRR